MWKKYTCAPVERRPGALIGAVDDPQHLKRLDGIRAMNLSPRYEFWVGLKQDIMAYIASSYGEAMEVSTDSADLARIIETLSETDGEVEEEKNSDEPEIDETDSALGHLA